MPSSPNKLSQFWQELKRRNVVRVVTVYAGAAFVIIELINNITEPLRLPEWTPTLVIVLLAIGFPIVIIFSWIYDVHPEGGIVKTEPAEKVKTEEVPKSSNSWKIASYISFVVIVGLIILNVIPRTGQKGIQDKSIAVLPFDNDGPASENAAYINGYCTAVHSDLCKINDLRVIDLRSTEQYRNQPESIHEIAENLGVGYVLSARGQIINNRVRITVYLTDASDEIIWSHPYDRQIETVADHIEIQSEIAQLVAKELQATITPKEKEIIESIPTSDMAAYDHYQRAQNEIMDLTLNPLNASRYDIIQETLAAASENYKLALASDPGFAEAYVGLGKVHNINYDISGFLSEADLDSVLYYAERALAYNDRLASAYSLKGGYYLYSGNINRAKVEFEVARELNPNNFDIYWNLGSLFGYIDGAQSIYYFHKAYALVSGDQRAGIRRTLVFRYASMGLFEEANDIAENSIRMDGDSTAYMRYQATIEMCRGNFEKSIEWQFRVHRYNPQIPLTPLGIARFYGYLRQYEVALTYAVQYLEQEEMTNWSEYTGRHHMALVYWHTGFREKAEEMVHDQIAYQLELIEKGGIEEKSGVAYFDLFLCYAFLGDKTDAYKNYYLFLDKSSYRWAQFLTYLQDDPLADNLRDDEEYQQIVRQYEAEFQTERDRIRQWLEENDVL